MADRRLQWEVEGRTDPGRVRSQNEDAFLLAPVLGLVAVCDGMGGHLSGEVASALAVETLRSRFASAAAGGDSDAALLDAITEGSARIWAESQANPSQRGMGTTVVAAHLGDAGACLAWAGDSRAYLLHGGKLRPVTRDHSLLEEFIEIRRPSALEIASFPHKNVITRAMGIEPEIEPELRRVEIVPGDLLLLCSDGLSGMVGEGRIEQILAGARNPGEACEWLVDAANEAGGHDNITAVVARAF